MWSPDALWEFTVGETYSRYVFEGINLMICCLVHWLMKFWNGGDDFRSWTGLDSFWPMSVDSFKQVRKPLAHDVVADKNDRDQELLNG